MLKIRNYSYIWSEYRTLYVLGITLITKIGKNTMALLDQIDIKILQALQNNAKVNMKELISIIRNKMFNCLFNTYKARMMISNAY